MSNIFVGYSRPDQDLVAPLVVALKDHGWSVWWDPLILPGMDFNEVIEKALDEAKAVICVWTEAGIGSRGVRNEAALGAARNILVPVLFGDVRIPLAFRRIQAADLSGWKPGVAHAGFSELITALDQLIGSESEGMEVQEPEPADPVEHGVTVAKSLHARHEERTVQIAITSSRGDVARVQELHDKLTEAGHDVWFDRHLHGGVEWWNAILDSIRSADLLIHLLSPESMVSQICESELEYAEALGRPIIAIMVQSVDSDDLPDSIASHHVLDFVSPTSLDWWILLETIQGTELGVPLPDPLPPPPPAPGTYLFNLMGAGRRLAQSGLTVSEQRTLLQQLTEMLEEREDPEAVLAVLEQFRRRDDLVVGVADEIDRLLDRAKAEEDFGPERHEVFLSYAREDALVAEMVAAGLGRRGLSVFWDRRVPLGSNWADVLEAKLSEAQVVLVLWSEHSVHSDWVVEEAREAKRLKKALLPARLDAVLPPFGFRGAQAADLANWAGDPDDPDFAGLSRAVSASLT